MNTDIEFSRFWISPQVNCPFLSETIELGETEVPAGVVIGVNFLRRKYNNQAYSDRS